MRRYDIVKATRNIRLESDVSEGCTLETDNPNCELLERFESISIARQTLEKYTATVDKLQDAVGSFFAVAEIFIAENIYNDNGDFESHVGIWDFANGMED